MDKVKEDGNRKQNVWLVFLQSVPLSVTLRHPHSMASSSHSVT